jgi:hypothetical protein
MVEWFFADTVSIGQRYPKKFVSSFSAEEDSVRSQEREIPIPMLAFATAMVCPFLNVPLLDNSFTCSQLIARAELILWEKGRRVPLKFDADAHSGAFDSHLTLLNNLREKSLVELHRLLAYLHHQGS